MMSSGRPGIRRHLSIPGLIRCLLRLLFRLLFPFKQVCSFVILHLAHGNQRNHRP